MRKFIYSVLLFLLPIFVFIVIGICLPTTPKQKHSYIYTAAIKDSVLIHTPSPKLVFVGGSNLAFGLDCQKIKDSLNISPVNLGLHAGTGLKYMLDSALPHINEGDILIISPEYDHFISEQAYGSSVLIELVFNVRDMSLKEELLKKKENLNSLNIKQWSQISKYIFPYIISKFNINEYCYDYINSSSCYNVESFNIYGDNVRHWSDTIAYDLQPYRLNTQINSDVIKYLASFCRDIEAKKAKVYISFPCFLEKDFDYNKKTIELIHQMMCLENIKMIGSPDEYKFSEEYMYDTNYHLNKKGVDIRTSLLIKNLKEIID